MSADDDPMAQFGAWVLVLRGLADALEAAAHDARYSYEIKGDLMARAAVALREAADREEEPRAALVEVVRQREHFAQRVTVLRARVVVLEAALRDIAGVGLGSRRPGLWAPAWMQARARSVLVGGATE